MHANPTHPGNLLRPVHHLRLILAAVVRVEVNALAVFAKLQEHVGRGWIDFDAVGRVEGDGARGDHFLPGAGGFVEEVKGTVLPVFWVVVEARRQVGVVGPGCRQG